MKEEKKAPIKAVIEYDEERDKFAIVCENLRTLNRILNMIAYANEKIKEHKQAPSE